MLFTSLLSTPGGILPYFFTDTINDTLCTPLFGELYNPKSPVRAMYDLKRGRMYYLI